MATAYYYRERNSGGTPRTLLTPTDTIDMGTSPTGIVVILYSAGATFNGCRYGGTDDGVSAGYNSGTALTDSGVGSDGMRVYSLFGGGLLTGNQIVSYSKSAGENNTGAIIIVFDSETDIAGIAIAAGSTSGTPSAFSVTNSSTTSGRKVFAAGAVDLGSGTGLTVTGGSAEEFDTNGTYVARWAVLSKTAAGSSTTLNAETSASAYVMALFEAVAGGGDTFLGQASL
jgi:hypothetical protein